jgi:hypothetical protein
VCELERRGRAKSRSLPVSLYQQFPWFVQPYMHTLSVTDAATGAPRTLAPDPPHLHTHTNPTNQTFLACLY